MADAAVAAPASNGVAPAGNPPNPPIPPGLHHQDPNSLLAETAANRDKGSHGKLANGSEHMETEEVHSSTASGANGFLPEMHQNGVINNAADSTPGTSASDRNSNGHSHQLSTVSKPVVNGTTAAEATDAANSEANEDKVEGPPLKRMSWMESAANGEPAGNGKPATNGQPATNGHLDGRSDGAVNGPADVTGAVCCWLHTVSAIPVYWYIYAACCVFHLWSLSTHVRFLPVKLDNKGANHACCDDCTYLIAASHVQLHLSLACCLLLVHTQQHFWQSSLLSSAVGKAERHVCVFPLSVMPS